eukprot:1158344-Pelagomonas_calceolata.AAC.1
MRAESWYCLHNITIISAEALMVRLHRYFRLQGQPSGKLRPVIRHGQKMLNSQTLDWRKGKERVT